MTKAEGPSTLPPPRRAQVREVRATKGCVPPPRAAHVQLLAHSPSPAVPSPARRWVRFGASAAAALLLAGLGCRLAQWTPAEQEAARLAAPDDAKRLGLALAKLHGGATAEVLADLQALARENPAVPSLDYVLSLAHLQAGDPDAARRCAVRSLRKGERVSDSLALLSATKEALAPGPDRSEPAGQSLELLQQAMNADPANPRPYVEMAMRLRSQGANGAALAMIEEARRRLEPVDFRALLDTTEKLIRLETGESGLGADDATASVGSNLFGAAYLALRRGDATQAADLLAKAGQTYSPGTFGFLLGDPAWRGLVKIAPLRP